VPRCRQLDALRRARTGIALEHFDFFKKYLGTQL